MICYKDKTFCINEECSEKCALYLTDKIKKEAMAFGLPISQSRFDWRECLLDVPDKEITFDLSDKAFKAITEMAKEKDIYYKDLILSILQEKIDAQKIKKNKSSIMSRTLDKKGE